MLRLCCCPVDSQVHPTFFFILFIQSMLAKWCALDSWAMSLTSVFLLDVCNRKKGTILQRMINSCCEWHKIFPVLSSVNTWRDDRSTHSSSDLCVHNNRQHQALERCEQGLQRYAGLQGCSFFIFWRSWHSMVHREHMYWRSIWGMNKLKGLWCMYSAKAISKCCGVRVLLSSLEECWLWAMWILTPLSYLASAFEYLMGSFLLQSGGVHFHLTFYTSPKMCYITLLWF